MANPSQPNIVVIDGYTMNPGDLDWGPLEGLGPCTIHERTPAEQLYERSRDADAVITNKALYDRAMIGRLPRLRYIGVSATGYNVVDLDAARERGIPVTNVPGYGTDSVVQATLAHILALARRVEYHSETVRAGKWSKGEDFCYWDYPQVELTGRTLGLMGCGQIGRGVARVALALGMQVIANDPSPQAGADVKYVDMDTLFREADVVSLHCPLTEQNREIINAETLSKMKSTAWLINTARGPLVNEADLTRALNEGSIGGAGLDVLNVEPPAADNPLFRAKNCHITPHLAWASRDARRRVLNITAENLRSFLEGNPVNVVNG